MTPSSTRRSTVIHCRCTEYWKKSTPATARKIPPSTAAPRTPSQRSHSMRGRGGAGAFGGSTGNGGGGRGAGGTKTGADTGFGWATIGAAGGGGPPHGAP